MKSLFAKMSFTLLAIIFLMGSALFAIDRHNTRVYYEELSQALNMPIAMYVTGQSQLINAGQPDLDSLHELAARAMVINPTAEIYLLNADGDILGHGLAPETDLKERVDLAPIQAFMAEQPQLPLRGTDPRANAADKIFSASPIMSVHGLEGYLYVVLGGATYEALAADIGNSYTGRTGAYAAAGVIVFAALLGLLLFGLLTKRLKRLSREIRRITDADFEVSPTLPLRSHDGDEIDGLSRAFVDMSAKINLQIDQLKENDRLRRELVSNISHDLRTPLSAIQGYIETLIIKSATMGQDEQDKFLRIARKHTLRLNVLIGDLFELSKLDAASVTPALDRFSLAELLQDVAQEFRIEMDNKGLSLAIEMETEDSQTVGDIGLIQRVLENLMRNAVKFTPAGGQITLSIAKKSNALAVAVSDTGPGISEAELPRIFDRFYRTQGGEEARSDSSGLGLAIVKRILDLHDSSIVVQSTVDTGTRFEFELPIYQKVA